MKPEVIALTFVRDASQDGLADEATNLVKWTTEINKSIAKMKQTYLSHKSEQFHNPSVMDF